MTAIYIDYPNLIGISNDNLAYETPFLSYPQSVTIGLNRLFVRYISYEIAVNVMCLKIEGKYIVLCCCSFCSLQFTYTIYKYHDFA